MEDLNKFLIEISELPKTKEVKKYKKFLETERLLLNFISKSKDFRELHNFLNHQTDVKILVEKPTFVEKEIEFEWFVDKRLRFLWLIDLLQNGPDFKILKETEDFSKFFSYGEPEIAKKGGFIVRDVKPKIPSDIKIIDIPIKIVSKHGKLTKIKKNFIIKEQKTFNLERFTKWMLRGYEYERLKPNSYSYELDESQPYGVDDDTYDTFKKVKDMYFGKIRKDFLYLSKIEQEYDLDMENALLGYEIFCQLAVGLLGRMCPHFVETYYVTRSIKEPKKLLLMMENVDMSLYEFLDSVKTKTNFEEIVHFVFIQLTYALFCAQEYFDFIHGDVTLQNIRVNLLDKEQTMYYKFSDDIIYEIKCSFMIKFIDFDESYVRYPKDKEIDKFPIKNEMKRQLKHFFEKVAEGDKGDYDDMKVFVSKLKDFLQDKTIRITSLSKIIRKLESSHLELKKIILLKTVNSIKTMKKYMIKYIKGDSDSIEIAMDGFLFAFKERRSEDITRLWRKLTLYEPKSFSAKIV